MLFAIPIAWLQLIHHKVRLIATLMGLAFVVTLLFMQLGFQDALFTSSVRVHQNLVGDLFLISQQYKSLTAQQSFPRNRLYQTLASDDVESVSPVYFQFGKLKNIDTGQKFSIFVFGIDPGKPVFKIAEVKQNLDKLKFAGAALFNRDSRPEFGPIAERFEQQGQVSLEIAPFNDITEAVRFDVRGLFTIGPSFGVDGNLITNQSTFAQIFRDRSADEIDIGLVNLRRGASPTVVRDQLAAYLPTDVKVLTAEEFITLEKSYWQERTPVGFTFRTMVTMGFIVGIGIAYQVLYSNIASHLVEYATLKAIGFTNNYLLNSVFKQALILAGLGYIPGLVFAFGIFDLAKDATGLPVNMRLDSALIVLGSIVTMCSVSGVFAIQKLRSADPADIF